MGEKGEKTKEKKEISKSKIAIIVLIVLLLLSACGLAVRYIYLEFFAQTRATVTVPDNLIGDESTAPSPSESEPETPESPDASEVPPQSGGDPVSGDASGSGEEGEDPSSQSKPQAVSLALFAGRPDANERFEVKNLLPGDSETRYFCIQAFHDHDIDLFFRAEVTEETRSLGDVLQVRITDLDSGKTIFTGTMAQLDGKEISRRLAAPAESESLAYYRIDVFMDTSVGNEYQAAQLSADFHWYVKDDGLITPTGVALDVSLWAVLGLSALLLLILLLVSRRRKEEKPHGHAE